MFSTMLAFKFTLCMCLVVGTVIADVEISESDLRRALFANYDKLVRPVRNANFDIHMELSLIPVRIKDVDTKDRTVKLDTYLHMLWPDSYMRWEPSEYGGITELAIPASEIWRPDVALYTASPDTSTFPTVMTNAKIFSNGTVVWFTPFSLKSRCPPSDNQGSHEELLCILEMGSVVYDATKLVIHTKERDILEGMGREFFKDTDDYWSVDSILAHSSNMLFHGHTEPYTHVTFEMLFRKKSNRP